MMGLMRIAGRPTIDGYYIEAVVGIEFYRIYGTGIMDCVSKLKKEIEK